MFGIFYVEEVLRLALSIEAMLAVFAIAIAWVLRKWLETRGKR